MPDISTAVIVRPQIGLDQITVPVSSESPFDSLPSELLLEIFAIATLFNGGSDTPSTALPVMTIAAVSQRFRAVIESSPQIWANTVDFRRRKECVEKFLELSGRQLHIHRANPNTLSCDLPRDSAALWQWNLLINHRNTLLERCKTLQIKTIQCVWNIIRSALIDRNIVNVSNLRIKFGWHDCKQDKGEALHSPFIPEKVYPSLRSILLIYGCFKLPKGSFSALTTLSIHLKSNSSRTRNHIMSALEWIDFLKSVPQLENLHLVKAIHVPKATDVLLDSSPATLACLKALVLHGIHDRRLGILLDNLRISPSCNITITALVRTPNSANVNGGPIDYIDGLVRFLKAHYSGDHATPAPLGSSLFISAANTASTSTGCIHLRNFNCDETYNSLITPNGPVGGCLGVPRLDLYIKVLGSAQNPLSDVSDPLFNRVHEELATVGLAIPFSSVADLFVSWKDPLFAHSSAQRSFFHGFSNVRTLTLQEYDSLWNMRATQESIYVYEGLFPKLKRLRLMDIDFTRVWHPVIENIYDFQDPIGHLMVLLETRISKSAVTQIQTVDLVRCYPGEGVDLESELGGLGVDIYTVE